jgi:hypothetical protein
LNALSPAALQGRRRPGDQRMIEPSRPPAAWVIAVSMGYGHQRTAHPLRGLAPDGEVLLANDYPGMPEADRAIWERTRRFYELISNVERTPLVGRIAFAAFDLLQRILRFYPRRDLSSPDWNVRAIYSLIRQGWGKDLIARLGRRSPALPIVTTFFTPAFMAEHFDYPGEIYCTVCDADVARVWASLSPRSSRIRYFAPNGRVAERLALYGVDSANVFLTGYPLPEENTGDQSLGILKEDLRRRILRLDPTGTFLARYGSLVTEKLGALPARTNEPPTILFSIGGAGAQKEIGAALVGSLRRQLARNEVRVVLAAGVKPLVRDYLEKAVRDLGLPAYAGASVEILFADCIDEYFRRFNLALRSADVLWTKPSELSFFTALGLPIVMAPPLGSQEQANREWLLGVGSAVSQQDARYADEWLTDLVKTGWLAEAAMQGFVDGTQLGTFAIRAVVESAADLRVLPAHGASHTS